MRRLLESIWKAATLVLVTALVVGAGMANVTAAEKIVDDIRVQNYVSAPPGGIAEVGDEMRFVLAVTNQSAFLLTNVKLHAPQVGLNGLELGNLDPGASGVTAGFYTVTEADLPGPVENTLTVTGQIDPGEFGDITDVEITVTETVPLAALSLTKVAAPIEITLGESVTYTFTVENIGSVALDDVTITDATIAYTEDLGTLAPGESRVTNRVYTPAETDFVDESFTNVALVAGTYPIDEFNTRSVENSAGATVALDLGDEPDDDPDDPDDEPEDDSDDDPADEPEDEPDDPDDRRTTPEPRTDLSVSKSVDRSRPEVGQEVVFTVTVTNEGPDDAEDVALIDVLPSGLSYVDASSTQGTYDPVTGVWEVGALANGDSATPMLRAKTEADTAGRTLQNTARITDSEPRDGNPGNNSASASVTPHAPQTVPESEPDDPEPTPAPPLPVTGGSDIAFILPGLVVLGVGLYLRRRWS